VHLSDELKNQIRERFSPHADSFALIAKDAAGDKLGQRIDGEPSDETWEKHFAGDVQIGLCPMAKQGLVSWAVLDIDDILYDNMPRMSYQGHYPSANKKTHIYFRFDTEVPVHEASEFISNVAAHLGSNKADIFPSTQGKSTVSLPHFRTEAAVTTFLSNTDRGRSIQDYYELLGINSAVPPCIPRIAKDSLEDKSDDVLYHGVAALVRGLGDSYVAPVLDALGDLRSKGEAKLKTRTQGIVARGCAMIEAHGFCAGSTCPHHKNHRKVTTSTAPSDGVEVYLSADHVEEAYAICNLEDGSMSTFYVKFSFCPEHYIPFKSGGLTDRLALKRNIAGIAMRTIHIEKETVAALANRVMAAASKNPKSQHVGHTAAVMSGIAVILDDLPHTPPDRIADDQGMWASNTPDGRTAVPKAALVEQLTRHVKEATRTNIHATLQRLCETGYLEETTLANQIVFTIDAPTRLRFQTQKEG
jgi:hypothetical protein